MLLSCVGHHIQSNRANAFAFTVIYSDLCVPDETVAPPQKAGLSERQVSSVWDAALPNALTLSPVLGRDNTTVLVGTDSTLVCIKISDGRSSKRLVCVFHAL